MIIENTPIETKSKRMVFGKFRVCSECGQPQYKQGNRWDCKEHHGAEPCSLKAYSEKKTGKPFVEEEWGFEASEIYSPEVDELLKNVKIHIDPQMGWINKGE